MSSPQRKRWVFLLITQQVKQGQALFLHRAGETGARFSPPSRWKIAAVKHNLYVFDPLCLCVFA